MSLSSWDRFVIKRNSITKRDKDGRLKLKGLSKHRHEDLLLLWSELTGVSDLSRKALLEMIEQHLNETDEELFLEELAVRDGAIDLKVKANPELIATLAEQMSATLEEQGAANYCEWQFQSAKTGKGYTLLVQRKNGLTPAMRYTQLKTRFTELSESWAKRGPKETIRKNIGAALIKELLEEKA